jgi:hypothetical protein
MLTKEEILARRPTLIEPVPMPEWGGTVYVRELSAAERDAFEAQQIIAKRAVEGSELHDFRAKIIVLSACDADGNRMFDDSEIPAVSKLPVKELQRLFDAGLRVGAISESEAEAIEENS